MSEVLSVERRDRERANRVQQAMVELDMCGCGEPEPVLLRMLVLLEEFERPHDARRLYLDQCGWAWTLPLYWLDREAFIEHGGSVSAGWLTARGEAFLGLYRDLGPTLLDSLSGDEMCPGCLKPWGGDHAERCPVLAMRQRLD